tara:strand:+ start:71 stop:292 length:222 start_codon:yes stop_codon:yes gene_type:complete
MRAWQWGAVVGIVITLIQGVSTFIGLAFIKEGGTITNAIGPTSIVTILTLIVVGGLCSLLGFIVGIIIKAIRK